MAREAIEPHLGEASGAAHGAGAAACKLSGRRPEGQKEWWTLAVHRHVALELPPGRRQRRWSCVPDKERFRLCWLSHGGTLVLARPRPTAKRRIIRVEPPCTAEQSARQRPRNICPADASTLGQQSRAEVGHSAQKERGGQTSCCSRMHKSVQPGDDSARPVAFGLGALRLLQVARRLPVTLLACARLALRRGRSTHDPTSRQAAPPPAATNPLNLTFSLVAVARPSSPIFIASRPHKPPCCTRPPSDQSPLPRLPRPFAADSLRHGGRRAGECRSCPDAPPRHARLSLAACHALISAPPPHNLALAASARPPCKPPLNLAGALTPPAA